MVTYKEKSSDEESCQVFVPFISDVRVGNTVAAEAAAACGNEGTDESQSLSNSYGHGTNPFLDRNRTERITPPSSPNISKYSFDLGSKSEDGMELQLDYWIADKHHHQSGARTENGDNKKVDSEKSKKQQDPKSSIRTTFRSLSVTHLLSTSPILQHSTADFTHFSMTYVTKEKRPKAVLKIGKKKEKSGESDGKVHSIDGISRLICMTKSSHPLKVLLEIT